MLNFVTSLRPHFKNKLPGHFNCLCNIDKMIFNRLLSFVFHNKCFTFIVFKSSDMFVKNLFITLTSVTLSVQQFFCNLYCQQLQLLSICVTSGLALNLLATLLFFAVAHPVFQKHFILLSSTSKIRELKQPFIAVI